METAAKICSLAGPVYHATPLHFLPEILASGALLSQKILGKEHGRVSARRRDRLLDVDSYVHCSLTPRTPLLVQKLARGYPHAVFEIELTAAAGLTVALLPGNTKAWRAKWQCIPVTERHDIDRLLRLARSGRRFTSLEVLVEERIPLRLTNSLTVPTLVESALVAKLFDKLGFSLSLRVSKDLGKGQYTPMNLLTIGEYFERFDVDRSVKAPLLPFD